VLLLFVVFVFVVSLFAVFLFVFPRCVRPRRLLRVVLVWPFGRVRVAGCVAVWLGVWPAVWRAVLWPPSRPRLLRVFVSSSCCGRVGPSSRLRLVAVLCAAVFVLPPRLRLGLRVLPPSCGGRSSRAGPVLAVWPSSRVAVLWGRAGRLRRVLLGRVAAFAWPCGRLRLRFSWPCCGRAVALSCWPCCGLVGRAVALWPCRAVASLAVLVWPRWPCRLCRHSVFVPLRVCSRRPLPRHKGFRLRFSWPSSCGGRAAGAEKGRWLK
jgi:hypothetical protein